MIFDCCWEGLSLGTVSDLGAFSTKTRGGVSVREGQGVVLMCTPPLHSPGKRFFSEPWKNIDFLLLAAFGTVNKLITIPYECPHHLFTQFTLYYNAWFQHLSLLLSIHVCSSNDECDKLWQQQSQTWILWYQICWTIRNGKKCYIPNYFT